MRATAKTTGWRWAAVLTLACAPAMAGPVVTATIAGFEPNLSYNLSVAAGDDTVIGVIVVNGYSVFGLGPTSFIQAPADWNFIPPFDTFADGLFYSSAQSSADIAPNQKRSGFEFDSSAKVAQFNVQLVTIGGLVDVKATVVPEPSYAAALLLVALGAAGWRCSRWEGLPRPAPRR